MDDYDAYDFQDVPAPAPDFSFQDAPAPAADYDSYDFQGAAPGALQAVLEQLSGSASPTYGAQDVSGQQPGSMQPAFNAAKDSQAAYTNAPVQSSGSGEGALGQIMKGLGLSGNLKDPKNLDAWMKLLMGGSSLLNSLVRRGTPQNGPAARQPGPYDKFNPQQQQWASGYFNTQSPSWQAKPMAYASAMPSSVVPGQRYAEGGDVMGADMGGTPSPGALQLVAGQGSGQDDLVDAQLSPGEYVFDADVVSALGDGSNEAGAAILDKWRENLRAFKRAAPPTDIPPPAGDPNNYLPEGALNAMGGA